MIRPQIKPVRHIEKKYREWISSLPCLVNSHLCHLNPTIDPHHVIPDGGGKTGSKVDDSRCVPLCRVHHDAARERDRFQRKYGINFEREIEYLNARYNREHPQRPSKVRVKRVQLCVKCSCKGIHPVRGGRYYCTRTRKYQEVA